MPRLKTEVIKASEFSPELVDWIHKANDREFGGDSLVYAAAEWYIVGFLKRAAAGHVGILQRTITVAQKPLHIGGVCYLVTKPEYRNRGIGSTLMAEAVTFLKDGLRLPFGLLTCRRTLEAYYEKAGWRTVIGPTVFAQKDGMRDCRGLTMIVECGETSWPEGKIDLCGFPW